MSPARLAAAAAREIAGRARDAVRGRRLDRRLTEEIEAHLDLLAAAHEARGLPPGEARAAARRAFGGVEQMKERYRDQRGFPVLAAVTRDVRFGLRMLVKDPLLTLAAVTALALGIGLSTTVFTVANAILLRGLPVEQGDRVMHLGSRDADDRRPGLSWPDFQDWRAATRAFTGLAAFHNSTFGIADEGRPAERTSGTFLSASAFRLLGVRPALGRDFLPEDDRPGAPAVVMLGHALWTTRYGADAAIVGRPIGINGVPATVIGVMPAGFRFPFDADLWQPLARVPGLAGQPRDARTLDAFGRLADGVTIEQARADLAAVAARLARVHPDTNRGIRPAVAPYHAYFTDGFDRLILIAMLAVGFLLLIACANVANLLLSRAAHRTREMVVRAALGASRWRILRQLLVESLLLASLAGIVGLALSVLGVRLFERGIGTIVKPYWIHWTMDGRVLAFLTAVSFGTVLIFGLAPALHVSRASRGGALKEGGRTAVGGVRAKRWSSALVVGELAVTLMLLAGGGLMLRSFLVLYRADRVIDTAPLLTVRVTLPPDAYPTADRRMDFHRQLAERLKAVPSIAAASTASMVPFGPGAQRTVAIDDRARESTTAPPLIHTVTVGPRYFETLGVRLTRGRGLTDADSTPGAEAAVVNERFAAAFFPGENPIGRRIRVSSAGSPKSSESSEPSVSATIVGVSPTIRQQLGAPGPVVYLPNRGEPAPFTFLIVRGRSDPRAVVPLLREEVRAVDPDLPLFGVLTMDEVLAQSRLMSGLFGGLFAVFAAVALVLSAVGLYAVTAYAARQRTQEIGVRMALGARTSQVGWLILRRGLIQMGLGLALGVGGALLIGRLLRGFLIQTSPTDPVTLFGIAGLLVSVSVAACLWPAWRASRLDPVAALRHE